MATKKPEGKQHRTNVTNTELTDKPTDQGSRAWAERRGKEGDEADQTTPEEQPAQ